MPAPAWTRAERWRLSGGIVGPVAFVAAWALAGMATDGYSPVDEAISELAAIGAPTRVGMTAGFLTFAAGVGACARPFGSIVGGGTGPALLVAAVATAGAAVFPLGASPWAELHGAFAGAGYLALAAAPLLAARVLIRAGDRRPAILSATAGVVGACCLAASLVSEDNGLWQRLGLTTLDLWLVVSTAILLGGAQPSRRMAGSS